VIRFDNFQKVVKSVLNLDLNLDLTTFKKLSNLLTFRFDNFQQVVKSVIRFDNF